MAGRSAPRPPRQLHEALVLAARDFGEGHRVVELLTPGLGRITAFANHARASSRRFGGGLQPMWAIEAALVPKVGADTFRLEEARVLRSRARLAGALDAIALGSYLVQLTGALARDAQPQPALFALCEAGLAALEEGRWPPWGRVAFELGALAIYGGAPSLEVCVGCGALSEGERARFAPSRGGLLCPRCGPGWLPGDQVLSRHTLLALRALAQAGGAPEVLARAAKLPADAEAIRAAEGATEALVRGVADRPLKALDFLHDLRASGQPSETP